MCQSLVQFIIFSKSVPCVPKRVIKLCRLFSLFIFKKIQIDVRFSFLLYILSNDSKIKVFESKLKKKFKDYCLTLSGIERSIQHVKDIQSVKDNSVHSDNIVLRIFTNKIKSTSKCYNKEKSTNIDCTV